MYEYLALGVAGWFIDRKFTKIWAIIGMSVFLGFLIGFLYPLLVYQYIQWTEPGGVESLGYKAGEFVIASVTNGGVKVDPMATRLSTQRTARVMMVSPLSAY